MLKPSAISATVDQTTDRSSTESARQRFLVNIAANASYIGAQTVANLWMTPFLIAHLGVAAFGMIPLVNMVTSYLSIVTTALDSAVSRFLAIDLERRDADAANRTFNTALLGVIASMVALSPLIVLVGLAFPHLFVVPPGWEQDSTWLFLLASVAFIITVVGGIFAVSPFVYSRFVWSNAVNLAGLAIRIGLVAALFLLLPSRLWYAGAALLAGSLVSLAGYIFLWRKLTPELRLAPGAFDRRRLRGMMSMSGWLIVNMVGAVLLGKIDLIVVNMYFGADLTGGYAAVLQFALLVEYLSNAAAIVLRPIILAQYARDDLAGLFTVATQAVKLLGLAVALPVGLLIGFARPLLTIWLGPSFVYLATLLMILVIHLTVNLAVRPLLYVQNAYDKVKWPGIVTLISGAVALALAVGLAQWGPWGYLGVAVGVAAAWTAKNGIYMPIYTARIMHLRWWTYLPSLLPGVVGSVVAGAASYAMTRYASPTGWLTLISAAAAVSLFYAIFVWTVMLERESRALLLDLAGRALNSGKTPPALAD